MRAWFVVKARTLAETQIAVVADYGEEAFSAYVSLLGAPPTRYSEKGGSEVRRQWIVRHNANPLVFRRLLRQLRGKPEGEVVDVARRMPPRVKKPEPEAA